MEERASWEHARVRLDSMGHSVRSAMSRVGVEASAEAREAVNAKKDTMETGVNTKNASRIVGRI